MRKKNLKVQVAALAVTGVIAATPLSVRAEETRTPAAPSTEAAPSTATAASATTAPESAATTTAAPESAATTAGTGATDPATSSGASTTTSGTAGSTGAAAPVTVTESAADSATTVPNNVDNVVGNEYQGTKIEADGVSCEITTKDVEDKKVLSNKSSAFNGTEYANRESGDLVMKGDLSIKEDKEEQGAENFDSTENAAHDVEVGKKYSLKADLDVSAVTKAILASEKVGDKSTKNNAKDTYVNDLETGLRATFTMGDKLNGSFHLPTDLEDAKKHYALSASDGNRMIFRINYANSTFAKDKVSIAMDLDLSNITPFKTTYGKNGDGPDLYSTTIVKGEDGKDYTVSTVENFRHTFKRIWPDKPAEDKAGEYAGTYPKDTKKNADGTYKNKVTYNTSTFGNLREIVSKSAQKIQLIMTGVQFDSAKGNQHSERKSTETATEVTTTTTTTTEGTINGTLVGYMKASLGARGWGDAAYTWGAIQNDAGRDKVAGKGNDKVYLTVKFTDKERTVTPIAPVNPVQPENPTNPVQPVNPVTPSNGGNGGNGGGVSDRTPVIPSTTPSVTPVSNPGEVLGENRPAPTPEENTVTAPEKKGEVLGESRPNPSRKTLSTRAKVSTGDYNYTALWASLFGMSLVALAGFVVLSKKEEN